MKQLLILFSIFLFASCDKKDDAQFDPNINGFAQFKVNRTLLPDHFVQIYADNIAVGTILDNDSVGKTFHDLSKHQWSAKVYSQQGVITFYYGEFRIINNDTVNVFIPNE